MMLTSLKSTGEEFRQLKAILADAVEIAQDEPIESILLVGSLARGELTIHSHDESIELWSDIDLFLVTPSGGNVDELALRSAYRKKTEELQMHNPFFHIDFTVLKSGRLGALSPRISTFEAKVNGQTLWGRDVQEELPDVNLKNLDFGSTRHLILVRLTEMLFYMPRRVVDQSANDYEWTIFGYVQARNALDILTILLPHEKILLPNYTSRIEYLQDHYQAMTAREWFGTGFVEFQEKSLANKLRPKIERQPAELYERTLEGYGNLLRFLLQTDPLLNMAGTLDALERSHLTFRNGKQPFRQHLADLKAAIRSTIWRRPALLPGRNSKTMITFLFWMHGALLARLKGDSREGALFDNARQALKRLTLHPLPALTGDFSHDWLALRDAYLDIYLLIYPAKMARRTYYEQLLYRCYNM